MSLTAAVTSVISLTAKKMVTGTVKVPMLIIA